jgi:hypothetical protein
MTSGVEQQHATTIEDPPNSPSSQPFLILPVMQGDTGDLAVRRVHPNFANRTPLAVDWGHAQQRALSADR